MSCIVWELDQTSGPIHIMDIELSNQTSWWWSRIAMTDEADASNENVPVGGILT